MSPRVMAPCGFLTTHLPCVGAVTETEEECEWSGLMECNNNELVGGDDKCEVLMPHDLYRSIDYSINISTSPADLCNDLPTDLYAQLLPKSKRLLAHNAPECLEDQVTGKLHIDGDDNCKWKAADVCLPRETQEESIRNESGETSYNCMSPSSSRPATETAQSSRARKLSSNLGASQTAGRYQQEFRKHEKLLKKLSVLHSIKASEGTAQQRRRSSLQLPPVCGRSPPCDCPEDQLYAAKLRFRILKKISTLRQRHIRLRVIKQFEG